MFHLPKLKEECGVFGIYGNPEASKLAYLGLYALQHRGQESCGIVSSDYNRFYKSLGMGKVTDFFTAEKLEELKGEMAIGHVRYSTTGSSGILNAQPIVAVSHRGEMAVAHNGNITNAREIRKKLEKEGAIFQSTNDTEIVVHLIARSRKEKFLDAVIESIGKLKGAFSLLIMTNKKLIAVRDPWGFRPLSLGFLDKGYVIASETTAFDVIDAQYIRDIDPGEILIIENNVIRSEKPLPAQKTSQCVFELIYFAKPSSRVFGKSVYSYRESLGAQLAKEDKIQPDVVVPVPDSGRMAALGYAREKGVDFQEGLIRSHYIGRTFIEPTQKIRDFGVKIKFSPVRSVLEGKKVVVVDDSIVRGTTAKKIIKMIRQAGAKEIHFRISAPPTVSPCYYGIDFPNKEELIANRMSLDEIAKYLKVDSLQYISHEGMFEAAGNSLDQSSFCSACFDGQYPFEVKGFSKNENEVEA
jgi:amidophosphoribosyltransferase